MGKKIGLLLATIISCVYAAFYFSALLSLLLHAPGGDSLEPGVMRALLGHLAMMFWLLWVVGWYCWLLYQSPTLTSRGKAVWTIVFVVTAPFGLLVYWYLEVWRKPAVF